MDRRTFWRLIDKSRRESKGDPEAHMILLREELLRLKTKDIVSFDARFSEYHIRAYVWPLWGAADVIGGGCSDDGFADFRGWLISRGEKVYEAALKDPDSLLAIVEESGGKCQVEGFEYVAMQAWESLTGKSPDYFPAEPKRLPVEPGGTRWAEDHQLAGAYPELWKRYGSSNVSKNIDARTHDKPISKVELEGFGGISSGQSFIHTKFGEGLVEEAELRGNMAIVKIKFLEGVKWLVIQKGCSFLSRV